MKPITTVFLDRDGVINIDSPDFIKSWEEFAFIPGSRQAIARLTKAGLDVIVITNQSGINRGLYSQSTLEAIHANMKRGVADKGGRITDIFFCPHLPDEHCDCRKPKPGMIEAAARRHDIDLTRTIMVGDRDKDIQAGRAAGCAATILVQTGNGEEASKALAQADHSPDHLAADLAAAVVWILSQAET